MKFIHNLVVFGALIGITIGELFLINLPIQISILNTFIIGLAGIKAILIALFFQHVKDEPKSLSSMLLFALGLSVILIGISVLQVV